MFILDTDTLTLLFARHPRVMSRRNVVPSSHISITIITKIEVLQGRFDFIQKAASGHQLIRAQNLLDLSMRMLADIERVIPIETAAAREFDRLCLNKKLRKIGRSDLLIASIALAQKAPLVTRNVRHFRQVPGLTLENWAD